MTYILSGSRTPSGSFLGPLKGATVATLGATAIDGALKKADVSSNEVHEVFMGQVVQAGSGQAPARQATIESSLGQGVPATTVNKVCGSGMQSVILGHQSIEQGDNALVVAGGMESMSNAPFLLPTGRGGQKFGHAQTLDALMHDGLFDVYSKRPMGNCAEECARKYEFSREEQDAYAMESFRRSQKAAKAGVFAKEISPVTLKSRKGETLVTEDDGPWKANFEKIPTLRPAFDKQGTITAANASTLNDGAAALVLGGEKYKDQAKFKIISHAKHAHDPTWFTTAPVEAMKKSLQKADLKVQDIDLFEINEAFAIVPMAAMRELELDHKKVNIYGGGIGLGHPIGCSGARILVTLMNGLEQENGKYGLASICIGGGEALSIIIEKL